MPTDTWMDNWDYFMSQYKEFIYHRYNSRWHRHLRRQYTHRLYHVEYLDLDDVPQPKLYEFPSENQAPGWL